MGIAMSAEKQYGETPGGLQAPYVINIDGLYHMFYGDWENICLATSQDGKNFTRRLNTQGKAAMFTEGRKNGTRDPMVIKVGDKWHCYYTAHPKRKGAVYCRTSKDLRNWSRSIMVAHGGQAGNGPTQAECPHVVKHCGYYYLFRTQMYGRKSKTSIYRSKDPLDFGINDDKYLIATMPIAAPEIIYDNGKHYIAHLKLDLKGIRMNRLTWVPDDSEVATEGISLKAGVTMEMFKKF